MMKKTLSAQRPCDPALEGLQDVDDWDLTEPNPEWDVGAGSDGVPSPPPPLVRTRTNEHAKKSRDKYPNSRFPRQLPYRRNLASRFSPTSSSDIAPSLDESIESGPLSDLQSEDEEGRRSADCCLEPTPPLVNGRGGSALVHRLVEDIQSRDTDPDVWKKIEVCARRRCLLPDRDRSGLCVLPVLGSLYSLTLSLVLWRFPPSSLSWCCSVGFLGFETGPPNFGVLLFLQTYRLDPSAPLPSRPVLMDWRLGIGLSRGPVNSSPHF